MTDRCNQACSTRLFPMTVTDECNRP